MPKHKAIATWWQEEDMSELGWTRLPSSLACCHRLKGLSQSEQPGLVSTVSHSRLAPETEIRELSNNSCRTEWLEKGSWHSLHWKPQQFECLFGWGCTIKMERKNTIMTPMIPNSWNYVILKGPVLYSEHSQEAAHLLHICHWFSPASQHWIFISQWEANAWENPHFQLIL
jgi:hypothetical protein